MRHHYGKPVESFESMVRKIGIKCRFFLGKYKRELKYRSLAIEEVCRKLEEEIAFYMVTNGMEDLGLCHAALYPDGVLVKVKIGWSRVDINNDIRKMVMVMEGKVEENIVIDKSFCFVEKYSFFAADEGRESGSVKLFLPDIYRDKSVRKLANYDNNYISLVEMLFEFRGNYQVLDVINSLNRYNEISDYCQLAMGISLYPDSKSKTAISASSFISNALRAFRRYSVNSTSGAIIFSEPLQSHTGAHCIIVTKNMVVVRSRIKNLSTTESKFISEFEHISYQEFRKFLSAMLLTNYWENFKAWDLSAIKKYLI